MLYCCVINVCYILKYRFWIKICEKNSCYQNWQQTPQEMLDWWLGQRIPWHWVHWGHTLLQVTCIRHKQLGSQDMAVFRADFHNNYLLSYKYCLLEGGGGQPHVHNNFVCNLRNPRKRSVGPITDVTMGISRS